ncbi:ketopantoate reductase family protein [Brevibacillus massiliensis]|uniref:ketopantoate reductase family protein n=1 Tax=Brevibacillus massiliensis TaxID=1118054 RepID=UPI0002E83C11|nr:2-dehydropantoate 2-reductase [Brevibacillus massiliensis]
MKITVVGAGGIGGVIGGYLARNGEDITLVDVSEEHVGKMRLAGLKIQGNVESFTVPVSAMTMKELLESRTTLELVFLCVKAQHTRQAVNMFKHLLTPDSAVVSFQNGLCEQEIAALIGEERTIGCFVNLFSDYLEPGVVQYGGVGSLSIGELGGVVTPRVEEIVQRLAAWGEAKSTDNIWGYLWGKLGYAAVLSATALTNETIADLLESERDRRMLLDLASEVLAVAHVKKIKPAGFDDWEPSLYYPVETRNWQAIHRQMDQLIRRLRSYTKTRSGIWRDLAVRKRKTEVPYQFSPVIQEGEALGIDMTLTKSLVRMISEVEDGKREQSLSNLEELHLIHQKKHG